MNHRALLIVLAALAALPAACRRFPSRSTTSGGVDASAEAKAEQILVAALTSDQPPLAAFAAQVYIDVDRRPPVSALRKVAGSPDARVRTVVLTALGTTRRRQLVSLFRGHAGDPSPPVRLAAAFGLAMTSQPSRMADLKEALTSRDLTLRRMAPWLLGLTDNKSAVGPLKEKLPARDEDAVVLLRTAEALHRLGSDAGLDIVRAHLEHSKHAVRALAARLLGRMGDRSDVPRLEVLARFKKAGGGERQYLDDNFAAIAALARLGEMKRMSLLMDLADAPEPGLRVQAFRALGEAAYRPALPVLADALSAPEAPVRTAAAAAILSIEHADLDWRNRSLAADREEED